MVLRETPVSRSSADMVRTSAMLARSYSTLVDAIHLGRLDHGLEVLLLSGVGPGAHVEDKAALRP